MSEKTVPATLDMSALKEKAQSHIVGTFGMLIPDEQLQNMINAAIKEFFEIPRELEYETVRTNWRDDPTVRLKTKITPFQQMVWEIVKPLAKERLDKHLNEENGAKALDTFLDDLFSQTQFNDQHVIGAQRLMIAMAASMFGQVGKVAVQDFKDSLAMAASNANMPELSNLIWSMPPEGDNP